MKPQSLNTRARIQEAQERALDKICLEREKEGRAECVFQSFGGPELPVARILSDYDQMLSGLIGKA